MIDLFGPPRRYFDARTLPLMTRPSFRWELRSAMAFPFAMAALESGVVGVIAKKTFDADKLIVAAVAAAPMVANLTSLVWARLLVGKNRVRAVAVLQSLVIACVALIALAPVNAAGVWMLVTLVYLGRSFVAGLVTARSDVWRSNYPRSLRASIVGRYASIIALIISVSAAVIGGVLQVTKTHDVFAFRAMYIGCALIALIGVWAMSHVRWRGGPAQLKLEHAGLASDVRGQFGARGMLEVLRDDPHYRAYMAAQFVLGMSAMAGLAPFIIAVDEDLHLGYAWAITLTQVAPTLLTVITIPMWARLLNRVHIVRFRSWHAWLFVAANATTALGLGVASVPLLLLGRIVLGMGYGGGRLAWNLGHHDFAPRHLATLYMGIHVTLTGVRGAIASFLGVLLYAGWNFKIGGATYHYSGMKEWLFVLLAFVSWIASLMFLRLRRDMRRANPTATDA